MSTYYCATCHLFESNPAKSIYHCPDCKICRIGKGLGIDFYHCKKCNVCMAIDRQDHPCVERALESDCPICGEFMFTSTSAATFLVCDSPHTWLPGAEILISFFFSLLFLFFFGSPNSPAGTRFTRSVSGCTKRPLFNVLCVSSRFTRT